MDTKIKMNEPEFLKVNFEILFLLEKMRFRKFSRLLEVQETQIPQHFFTSQTLIQAKLNLFMVRKWNKFCLRVNNV